MNPLFGRFRFSFTFPLIENLKLNLNSLKKITKNSHIYIKFGLDAVEKKNYKIYFVVLFDILNLIRSLFNEKFEIKPKQTIKNTAT